MGRMVPWFGTHRPWIGKESGLKNMAKAVVHFVVGLVVNSGFTRAIELWETAWNVWHLDWQSGPTAVAVNALPRIGWFSNLDGYGNCQICTTSEHLDFYNRIENLAQFSTIYSTAFFGSGGTLSVWCQSDNHMSKVRNTLKLWVLKCTVVLSKGDSLWSSRQLNQCSGYRGEASKSLTTVCSIAQP